MNRENSRCRSSALWTAALAFVAASVAPVAFEQNAQAAYVSRRTCDQAVDGANMGKRMGQRNAARLVQAVWGRLGRSCAQLDRLATIISETPLARPAQGGIFAACFYLGYTDALWEGLDDAYNNCGVRCFNAGAEIGRISAEGYCAASVAVGGLWDPGFIAQPPLPFCGMNVAMGCKAEYVSFATYESQSCYRYTTGTFADVFENSVRQDCFVPSDVPIIDRDFLF